MIDHVSVGVADLNRAARFYEVTLAALGLSRLVTRRATVGFGKTYPEFWVNERKDMPQPSANSGMHVCLRARSKEIVDSFFAAALREGGASDGPPGMRPEYNDKYYAAFVRDLDGNRIEVVTFLAA